ncbi:SirB2 family protein [methane-oxidizing endosymbiont of Gigantopelta aegis]|uniref:SirB2 family protein n=1 Tax=methane-oxidizing endosymbiont of Gigantopelta aegis TaxID=2794938 RepID=UPI0018DE647D|nr:SirB2 family protein [methane-oxidizing endosymbiont of Gigantopelta aegis]
MLKSIHLFFVVLSFVSFSGRMGLSQFKSEWLQQKWLKIAPHIIDTCLLLSGVALVFYGQWLDKEYGWIISKLIILTVYVILGIIAMRSQGAKRWLVFLAAIACYISIFVIAITKHGFI